MGLSRDVTARELAGLTDDHVSARELAVLTDDHLHYGARAVARRVLGNDDPASLRTVYYWASELRPELRPSFIIKVAGRIAAWESAVQAHARQPAAS